MPAETPGDEAVQAGGSRIFRNGDTLVMSAPSAIDLSIYTTLYRFLLEADRYAINHILLDLSAAKTLRPSGIAAFRNLERLAADRRLRVLMLQPPADVRRQLATVTEDLSRFEFHEPEGGSPATGPHGESAGNGY